MSNMEAFNTVTAQIQRELAEDLMKALKEALAQPEPWEKFCDSNCVWTDHHPDCKLAERTWVCLTNDEIDQGLLRSDYAFKTAEAWRAGVVFAMTKLKEKNT